ncbi:hypothetical protein [Streptomyces sp. NPDC088358]|uniref:hypothetical protein n=1 Tax=Streptomyces sp. NPDC088358 TaxID=3365857 RepID=UPI00382C46F8
MLERIATRRAELDLLEEELVKQLVDVRVERDELVVAGRVVQRISEQGFGEYLSLAPPAPEVQVGGRSVLLIPARAAGIDPDVLPQDYHRLVAIVREAAGPVTVRAVGEVLGLPVGVRGWSRCGRSWTGWPTIYINYEYKIAMLRA